MPWRGVNRGYAEPPSGIVVGATNVPHPCGRASSQILISIKWPVTDPKRRGSMSGGGLPFVALSPGHCRFYPSNTAP